MPFAFVRSLANPPVFLATNLSQAEASRRSAEYVRMPPSQPKISRLQGERSQSFSSYSPPPPFDHLNRQNHGPMSAGHSQYGPPVVKKPPIVYPALLSRVANAFVQRITTSPRIKDSIEYKDCFDGRDAVVSFYEALYYSTYPYHTGSLNSLVGLFCYMPYRTRSHSLSKQQTGTWLYFWEGLSTHRSCSMTLPMTIA